MDFDFSEEQYMFQKTVRDLLSRELNIEQLRNAMPETVWSSLSDLGIFAIFPSEDDGGMGLGFTDLALVFEEFGRALVPSSVAASVLASAIIAKFGTAQQRGLLAALADGSARMTPAVVDPMNGPGTKVERNGDTWRLTGRKILVCEAASADNLLIVASLDGQPTLCLARSAQAGIGLSEEKTLDLGSKWYAVTFDAVDVELVGGRDAVEYLHDAGAVLSALQMTGIAARALDEALGYVGQRVQFDKIIGSFQAIKHRCADLAVDVETCRSVAYYAAWGLDEAEASERRRAASMAKSWCGEKAARACNESIQLHGGTGFTWDLGLHLFLRRAKIEQSLWGDAAWHRERLMEETVNRMEAGE